MAGIHFSVLNPDRHRVVLFLLMVASFSGTVAGTFFFLPGSLKISLFDMGMTSQLTMFLSLLLVIFIFGLCRFGCVVIPFLLTCFSALIATSFRKLCETISSIWSIEFIVPILYLLVVFLCVFFFCTQACVVSKNFPLLFSRRTHFAKPHRSFYVLEFLLLSCFLVAFIFVYYIFA